MKKVNYCPACTGTYRSAVCIFCSLHATASELLEAAIEVERAYGCECIDNSKHCPMCLLRDVITKITKVTS